MPQLDAPIILFCSKRCGSSMFGTIFDAHPQLCEPSRLFASFLQILNHSQSFGCDRQ